MKQRLGIAAALLKDPTLLILDEPGNGLDAAGIREIRELIQQLGASGVTVVLSSHQLSEVQQVCDRLAIMSKGRVIASGTVAELLASRTSGDVRVRMADPDGARTVLLAAGFQVADMGDAWRVSGVDDPGRVTWTLAQAGHYLTELSPIAADLESIFIELTEAAGSHVAVGSPA
jgi:ABC-2 type transport system ATP-binding protein